jgi:hypothetical protein
MPRKGQAYPVDDDWRRRVSARLTELGWKASTLAKESGMPKSTLSELLAGERKQTTYLPELHGALGWDPPLPPLPTPDAHELMYIWARLDDNAKARLLERGRVMHEELQRKPKK